MKTAKTIISTLFISSLLIITSLNYSTNNTACLQDVLFVSSYAVSNVGVTVGGVEITDANKHNLFGDNTVSFDDTTNTLTLNGATISKSCNDGTITTALSNLKIELKGSNIVENTKSGENGISAHNLSFTGNGSIAVVAGDGDSGKDGGDGIYASGDVVVSSSADISTNGGDGGNGDTVQSGNGEDGGNGGDGILVSGKLSVQNVSSFSIVGGNGGVGGSSAGGTSGKSGNGGNGINSPSITLTDSTVSSIAGDCKSGSASSAVCQAISTKPVLSFSNGSVYVYSGNGAPGNLVNNPIATDYHKQKYVHIDTIETVFPTPTPQPVVSEPTLTLIFPTITPTPIPTLDQNSQHSNSYSQYTSSTKTPDEQPTDISDWISSLTPTPTPTANTEASFNFSYNGIPSIHILNEQQLVYLVPKNKGDVPTLIKLDDLALTQFIASDGGTIIPFEAFKGLSSGKHILSVVFDDETYQAEVIIRGNAPISVGKFVKVESIFIPIIAICSGSVVVLGIVSAIVLVIKKRIKR